MPGDFRNREASDGGGTHSRLPLHRIIFGRAERRRIPVQDLRPQCCGCRRPVFQNAPGRPPAEAPGPVADTLSCARASSGPLPGGGTVWYDPPRCRAPLSVHGAGGALVLWLVDRCAEVRDAARKASVCAESRLCRKVMGVR